MVVREFGARNGVLDLGHVAIEAIILGVDRTDGSSRFRLV
jgi:hypothetical protein